MSRESCERYANSDSAAKWNSHVISTITTAGYPRKRDRSPVRSPPFAVFTVEFRSPLTEIRDVPQATVTNVFVYRQPGRGCHTRTRKARNSVARGLERRLERAGYDTHVKQENPTLISRGRDGIRFFCDARGFNFLFSLPLDATL